MRTGDELIEAVLAGRATESERSSLAGLLERDPALRGEFVRRAEIYHLLPLALEEENDAERFLDSIRARLQAKGDSQVFLAATRQRIQGARRRRSAWLAAGFAAAVLFAVVVWVATGTSNRPEPRPRIVEERTPKIVTPVPEVKTPEPEKNPEVASAPEVVPPPSPSPPSPKPKPVPPPPEKPMPAPKKTTVVRAPAPKPPAVSPYFATVDHAAGQVEVLSGPIRKTVAVGSKVFRRRGIRTTGIKSGAIVRYPDGTKLTLDADTVIWDVSDRPIGGEIPAKRILVAQGEVIGDVSAQPKDRPMVLVTPHGEAEVVGTILKLRVDAESTRLEMAEGKVRLTRKDGAASVDVKGGYTAVIAEGVPLAATPLRAGATGTPSGKPRR